MTPKLLNGRLGNLAIATALLGGMPEKQAPHSAPMFQATETEVFGVDNLVKRNNKSNWVWPNTTQILDDSMPELLNAE